MNVLLLGGTGFISSRLLDEAVVRGHAVTFVTRGIRPVRPHAGARHYRADRDGSRGLTELEEGRWDMVIDATVRTPVHARQSLALARWGRRLLMISTDYVYAPASRRLLQNEDHAEYASDGSYGALKREAEVVILEAVDRRDVEATILRPPHVYGPGSLPGTIPRHGRSPGLLDDIRAGRPLQLLQGGLGLIQPLYVMDLARIVFALFERPEASGQVLNCPGPEVMTHADYYERIGACLGCAVQILTYVPESREAANPYPMGHRYYDAGKLRKILKDFAYTPFSRGVDPWISSLLSGAGEPGGAICKVAA